MTPGKAAAQAGHGFVGALEQADLLTPDISARYRARAPGTKIVLAGGDGPTLERLATRLEGDGLPVFRVIDSGHVHPPDFDGAPILTALGVGPLPARDAPGRLRRLPLWDPAHAGRTRPEQTDRTGGSSARGGAPMT